MAGIMFGSPSMNAPSDPMQDVLPSLALYYT